MIRQIIMLYVKFYNFFGENFRIFNVYTLVQDKYEWPYISQCLNLERVGFS